jgi:phenylpropionate dioxygenase-like ring-hydroxylating dioxygenase large terminal subunit
MDTICKDKMLLNDWFVVGEHKLINNGTELQTFLLGEKILIIKDKIGNVSVLCKNKVMPMTLRYGFIWTSLGKPLLLIYPRLVKTIAI